MTEIELFRERLKNWGRVYRDGGRSQHESIAAAVIRLGKADPDEVKQPSSGIRTMLDYKDAEEVEVLVLKLNAADRRLIKVEYMSRESFRSYQTQEDYQRGQRQKAKKCFLYRSVFEKKVREIEIRLMHMAEKHIIDARKSVPCTS